MGKLISIQELAKQFRLKPEDLLKRISDAGLSKSSVDDTLSNEDRAKLSRLLIDSSQGSATPAKSSSGRPRAVTKSGARSPSSPKGGSRSTVTVEKRKRSIRVGALQASGATSARPAVKHRVRTIPTSPEAVAPKAQDPAKPAKPAESRRKRVYSAETKGIKDIGQEPEAIMADSAAVEAPPTQDRDVIDAPLAAEAPAGDAVGKKRELKPEEKAEVAAEQVKSAIAAAVAKAAKVSEAGLRKRTSRRLVRQEMDADTDLGLPSGPEESAVPSRGGPYDADSTLHIKQGPRKRRRVKTKIAERKENIHAFKTPSEEIKLIVDLPATIAIAELAKRLRMKRGELEAQIKSHKLECSGDAIDQTSAAMLVEQLGHEARQLQSETPIDRAKKQLKRLGEPGLAPPIVTIMGHVDHGKTTLIDHLRKSKIASGEYGAITQHIGAYSVQVPGGGRITFLDTPGHAAFAHMRERGAKITDVIVIVVAADDGVKPQTIESIEYAKRYGIPIVVAVNKVDKDNANPELVRNGMSEHGVVPSDWGGQEEFIDISALKGKNIDSLLEAILMQAEMIEGRKVCSQGDGRGYVIESGQRKGIGITATVVLKEGAIKKGDVVASAIGSWGRVRFLLDENDKRVPAITPGVPATLVGLDSVVEAGSEVFVTTEAFAKEIEAYERARTRLTADAVDPNEIDAEQLFANMEKEARMRTVNLYIKTDVQGSTDAVKKVLEGIDFPDFRLNIVACRQGGIHESDVQTASSTQSILLGFNVAADAAAKRLAESTDVSMKLHRSVYEIYDYVESLARQGLKPTVEYVKVGEARVREIFRSSAYGNVAGCLIVEGAVHKHDTIRVIRDSKQIYEGQLDSLRRFKDDVQVVNTGTECGIAVKKFDDLRENDLIEAFETREAMPSAAEALREKVS